MRKEITEEVDLMRAEIERLNKDLLAQNACCDGAAAQDAHVRREREEHRAEVDRLREDIERLHTDRRERIATAALQGLLSDPNRQGTFSDAVRISVEYADALIAELDKEERKP